MRINWSVSLVWLLLCVPLVQAQQTRGYSAGSVVADFRLRNVDDRTLSLADYKAQKGVVVIFTCNHCPFSKAYEDRILALDRKFGPLGYPVLAIMPNDPTAYSDDSFENMKSRARDKAYSFPYAIDETQAVARAFGASRTPQVYVLKKEAGDRFVLEYTGAIDDNPQDAVGVQKRYVDDVVTALLAGRPAVPTNTKAIGCGIKWK
ncbi:MAG: thioredoxin family protein [Bacteroidetes bacterium]|nr:thioredoxin family protein [Fibrella sp.]